MSPEGAGVKKNNQEKHGYAHVGLVGTTLDTTNENTESYAGLKNTQVIVMAVIILIFL